MKLLIDTQVFLWLINEDSRLGSEALRMLSDTSNQVLISYFSFFEITIKANIGKLKYDSSVIDDLPKMGIELVLPDIAALQNYLILNPDNKDPFDNILISVARNEKCTFMTSDENILATSASGLRLVNAIK